MIQKCRTAAAQAVKFEGRIVPNSGFLLHRFTGLPIHVAQASPPASQPRVPRAPSSVLIAAALLLATWVGQGAQRIVAWGDINYDLRIDQPVSQIAAGFQHSLSLKNDGKVLAWGDNSFNQTNIPPAMEYKPVAAISAGSVHNLALLADGSLMAWGPSPGESVNYGQCEIPENLGAVNSIAAGAVHNLAIRTDGTVAAWGGNLKGQCDIPPGLGSVIAVAGGMYHSLALRPDGTVVAWGDNIQGQTSIPEGLTNVVAIAAGGNHNLALRSDGTVVSWGTYGLAQSPMPSNVCDVVAIATADQHSLALKRDGSLIAWGFNTAGQCAIPPGLTNIIGISARGRHNMVLLGDASEELPALRIECANGTVTLSWPLTAVPVVLQQNLNLEPAIWSTVPNVSKLVGTRNALVLPASGSMFFRLIRK